MAGKQMSWNKETFKEKWKDDQNTKYWSNEWVENYERYRKEFNRVLDVLWEFQWKSLLEIGCGAGKNLKLIKQIFNRDISGTDINKTFLDIAKSDGLKVENQDTEHLTKKADVILSYEHLQHLHPEAYKNAVDKIKDNCDYVVIYEGQKNGGGVMKSGSGGRWSHNYEKDFGGKVLINKKFDNKYILLVITL